MATEEQKQENQTPRLELKERQKVENPTELLQNSLGGGLMKLGGFQIIKDLIKEAENMDPKRKAVKNIFLTDDFYEEERAILRNQLTMWISILEGGETRPSILVGECEEKRRLAEDHLTTNLKKIHEELHQLEVTYRTLDTFFANAGQGGVSCLTLMNVNKKNLKNYDSNDTKAIRKELDKNYDKIFLNDNYSLLVIPGYLGDAVTIREWAKTAYRYKVIMVTDFEDIPEFKMLREKLKNANLQGKETYLGNIIMTCNYLLGRKKSELANEDEDLFVPGSGALAGRMYDTEEIVIAQGAAGVQYGTLSNVKGTRFEMLKAEFTDLIDLGVIPMVEERGRTMAFSNRSLYNGGALGLKEYPIVRVSDWIGKVLQNFFNSVALNNWNPKVKADLQQAIHSFLSDYKGPGRLLEDYSLKKLDQDQNTKDIKVEVELKPYFAASNFYIRLSHDIASNSTTWEEGKDASQK